jgi:hypothetical protein
MSAAFCAIMARMPFETIRFDSIDRLAEALKRDDPPVPHVLPGELEFETVHGRNGQKIIPSHDGRRFLYRGQNRRWQPCIATVWRGGQPSPDSQLNWILSRVRTAEFERLLNQHPMMALARENSIEVDYDALAQHYGIPTFWLDITSNVDIACFFAVARFDRAGNITPSEDGIGVLYRVHWKSFDEPWRYFTSITHSPASRPGRQHGWSIGLQRQTDFDVQEFVEVFEFSHDRASSERILAGFATHLFPQDSITDVAKTLISAPAVTMQGIKAALARDGCPKEKIETVSNAWGERLCNGLGLDVYLDEEFALTEAQIKAGNRDADIARKTFFAGVGFRLVRRPKD